MEVKNLRQVMPGLKTAEHIMKMLDDIRVTRLVMPHSRDSLRIYIECPYIIPKKDIYVLEAAIKKQFFEVAYNIGKLGYAYFLSAGAKFAKRLYESKKVLYNRETKKWGVVP